MKRILALLLACAAVACVVRPAVSHGAPAGDATSNVARPAPATTDTAQPGATGPARQERAAHATPRRIDEINIEGEIAVPQVLFITARDQRRFMDFQHRRYLKTSLQVGRETVIPKWIAVVGKPADVRKETSP